MSIAVDRREVLVMFTRHPQPGRVKTRLIPALGPEGAARLQDEMTAHTVTAVRGAMARRKLRFEIRFAGGTARAMRARLGPQADYKAQGTGDLGARLRQAATEAVAAGATSVVLIGSDCPGLDRDRIQDAFVQLKRSPVVLGPARDGGYYLIGLRPPLPDLFSGIPWGTSRVLEETMAAARRNGVEPALLPELGDVDEPADLPLWEKARQAAKTISVIVPTLNEAACLERSLGSALAGMPAEVIVADGGSTDATVERARSLGARVEEGNCGRARQLNAGAAAARGEVLLFLHADTELPEGYGGTLLAGLESPAVVGGAFGFSIRDPFPGRAWVERTTNLRSRVWGMPYGDQGIFVRRWAFEALGGFPEFPLMEDYEFVRRLRRLGRVVTLNRAVRTSGRRWQQFGVLRVTLVHQLMILGYCAGVSPARLARFYRGRMPYQSG